MPTPPEVDRAAASEQAIRARRARATLKQQIAAGSTEPRAVLAAATQDAHGPEGTLRVPDFLRAIPGIGATKVERILGELAIAPVKRLGGLGIRQRAALESFLLSREQWATKRRGRLIVLAGPTAVGKGTVASYIRAHHPEVDLSVSATTRTPRPGEVDGTHYFFVSDAEFDRLVADDELLEWATVHNSHRYGTPRGPVEQALNTGTSVLLEIDIQGARRVREAIPEAQLVFLLPPSWEELVRRLTTRGTETAEEQARRLETARIELAAAGEFDHQLVNDDVARAAQKVVDLVAISRPQDATTQ